MGPGRSVRGGGWSVAALVALLLGGCASPERPGVRRGQQPPLAAAQAERAALIPPGDRGGRFVERGVLEESEAEERAVLRRRSEAYLPGGGQEAEAGTELTGVTWPAPPPVQPVAAAGVRPPVLVFRIEDTWLLPFEPDALAALERAYAREGEVIAGGPLHGASRVSLTALLEQARRRGAGMVALARLHGRGGERTAELWLYRSADGALLERTAGLVPSWAVLGETLRHLVDRLAGPGAG